MNKEFIVIRETIEQSLNSTFLSGLFKKIDEQILFIGKIRDMFKTHLLDLNDLSGEEIKVYEKIESYNKGMLSLLQENFAERPLQEFTEDFSGFIQHYSKFIEEIDEKRIEEQDNDRFRILSVDSFAVRAIKIIKKSAYFITTIPRRILNLGRKTFKR